MKTIKRQIRTSIIIVVSITVILIIACLMGLTEINHNQYEKTDKFLTQMNSQYKTAISRQIKGDFETLQGMSSLISAQQNFDRESLLNVLKAENENNRFIRMGFIDINGIAQLVDINGNTYENIDVSKMIYVKQVLKGRQILSDTLKDSLGDGYINVYAVPVYQNNTIIGALCAVNDAVVYRSILDLPSLGKGFSLITKANGELVIRSNADPNKTYESIYDLSFDEKNTKYDTMRAMKNGGSGSFLYTTNSKTYKAYYSPLGINNWVIVSVVKEGVLVDDMQYISRLAILAIIVIALLLGVLMIYIFIIIYRNRKSLEKIAYFDDITNTYTKVKFTLEANHLFMHTKEAYTMVLIDLDNFKLINELFGYDRGDALLCHTAKILHENILPHEMYYRYGGDCFGLLLKESDATHCVYRLKHIVEEICSFELQNDQHFHVGCHCGIKTLTSQDYGQSVDFLINRVMMALKECKLQNGEWYYIYDDHLNEISLNKARVEARMEAALKQEEFKVYLQPKYDISHEKIIGAEALVRWCVDGNVIYPDDFIPIFEKNGFIIKLDMYVLDKACSYLKEWHEKGYDICQINVNQSRLLFYRESYMNELKAILKRHHIKKGSLVLEVTESVALENMQVLQETIAHIHELGLEVSMDDFGSGYSSLNVLQKLAFDEIKLDREFIQEDVFDNVKQRMIIQKIIELSKMLHIRTVAEGVETIEQLTFLKDINCDIAQGYYFSKPVPKEDFEKLLENEKAQ